MDKLIDWIILILCIILFFRLQAVSIVRFYRDSCPACQASQAEWNKFKMNNMWNPLIKCVEVDTTTDDGKHLMQQYDIKTVPTVFKIKGLKIIEYNGNRSAADLTGFANDNTN